jgi:hypothetical protein
MCKAKGFVELSPAEKEAFAQNDGFTRWEAMYRYWLMKELLPFYGGRWHWDFERRPRRRRDTT